MTSFDRLALAAYVAATLAACSPSTPPAEPVGESKVTAAASAEPAPTVEAAVTSVASAAPKPARKTYDLAEYKLPFSIELGEAATHKKLSDAQAKAGFVGAIIYDDAANVGIRVHTVPARMRTIAGLKADLKAAYGATFLKEDGELLVYDQTNGGATKELGFTLRIDVGGTVFTCDSAVPKADTVEKLEASIAACKSLKPVK